MYTVNLVSDILLAILLIFMHISGILVTDAVKRSPREILVSFKSYPICPSHPC